MHIIVSLGDIGHFVLLGASALGFLYAPGALATIGIWKSMRWDDRIMISPLLTIMGIVGVIKILKMWFGFELISIAPALVLLGMNMITVGCVVGIAYCSSKKQSA